MALGPVRFVRKGDQQVQYRDWMTDPADLDSLLAWTNQTTDIQKEYWADCKSRRRRAGKS